VAKLGVLGTGTMGPQLAATLAAAGHSVWLYHHRPERNALPDVERHLRLLARRQNRPPDSVREAAARVERITVLEPLAACDVLLEAVIEDLSVKQALFGQLDALCPDAVVLASNTSNLDLAAIGSRARRRDRIIGMHFFNPIAETELVEVIAAPETSAQTLEKAVDLVSSLEKVPALFPESYVNRLLIPMINEACRILEGGHAQAEEIDRALRLAANHPIGPLALADLIGIDIVVSILQSLQARLGDHYRPAETLRRMLAEGLLGRKSGRGFYPYGKAKKALSA
jgi:3-hydroxybutyryl-CoA dehydrogenase